MNQQNSSNQSQALRFPSIFPEARVTLDNTRRRINDTIDPFVDSKIYPFIQGIISRISRLMSLPGKNKLN